MYGLDASLLKWSIRAQAFSLQPWSVMLCQLRKWLEYMSQTSFLSDGACMLIVLKVLANPFDYAAVFAATTAATSLTNSFQFVGNAAYVLKSEMYNPAIASC